MSINEYDAGLLNDFGGGNVGWWQDYIRAELGRAYEFYIEEVSALIAERDELRAKLEGGVRVEVYRDRYGELRAHQMKTSAGSKATLLIDDGVEI